MNIENALSPCNLGLKIMKSFQEIQSSRALAKVLRELAQISPFYGFFLHKIVQYSRTRAPWFYTL